MPRWLYILLTALPLALVADALHWPPLAVFMLAAVALIPLAGLIAVATEALAEHVGSYIGGLLNATFGNAPELIISFAALFAGLNTVVLASIAGSIIGNSLFVLGMSMVVGGWRYRLQRFDARASGQYASLLALAVVGLVIPSLVGTFGGGIQSGQDVPSAGQLHVLSTVIAVLLLLGYIAYLAHAVFRVRADRNQTTDPVVSTEETDASEGTAAASFTQTTTQATAGSAQRKSRPQGSRASRLPNWLQLQASPVAALIVLGMVTVLTAVMSEVLVGAIEPMAHQNHLSPFFVGLIVLPIVGNAAEHASAVTMALRNRMDATMAITAGSAIQVALFVAPVLVIGSDLVSRPLDFLFRPLELVIFALTAGLYALVSLDGESTWLEGLQLMVFYLIVAAAAFVVPM